MIIWIITNKYIVQLILEDYSNIEIKDLLLLLSKINNLRINKNKIKKLRWVFHRRVLKYLSFLKKVVPLIPMLNKLIARKVKYRIPLYYKKSVLKLGPSLSLQVNKRSYHLRINPQVSKIMSKLKVVFQKRKIFSWIALPLLKFPALLKVTQ